MAGESGSEADETRNIMTADLAAIRERYLSGERLSALDQAALLTIAERAAAVLAALRAIVAHEDFSEEFHWMLTDPIYGVFSGKGKHPIYNPEMQALYDALTALSEALGED